MPLRGGTTCLRATHRRAKQSQLRLLRRKPPRSDWRRGATQWHKGICNCERSEAIPFLLCQLFTNHYLTFCFPTYLPEEPFLKECIRQSVNSYFKLPDLYRCEYQKVNNSPFIFNFFLDFAPVYMLFVH